MNAAFTAGVFAVIIFGNATREHAINFGPSPIVLCGIFAIEYLLGIELSV
jgi:hypothetical protein